MAYVSLPGASRSPFRGLGRQSDGPPPQLCTGAALTERYRLHDDCFRTLNDICARVQCPVPPDSKTLWDPAFAQVGIRPTVDSCTKMNAGYMKVCGAVKDMLLAATGPIPTATSAYLESARQASAAMAASSAAAAAKAEASAKLQQAVDPIRSTAATSAAASAAAAAKAEAAAKAAQRQQQVRTLALVGGGILVVGFGVYWFMRR